MNVVVKFHSSSRPSVAAWQQRILAQPPHDPQMIVVLRDEMIRWLQRHQGRPPGTVTIYDPSKHLVARFSSDTWVHFTFRTPGRSAQLEVFILGLSDQPP